MPGIYNADWPTINKTRRYPLAVDATLVDTTGSFTLPLDWLVELQLPVHAGIDVDPSRFFVRTVGAYASGYTLTVAYQPTTGDPVDVAAAVIPVAGFVRNATYTLGGIAPFDDTAGQVTIGTLDTVALQPPGLWTFALEAARLDTDAIRPIIRGVSALYAVNGAQTSARLQGDIALVAGTNCRLDVVQLDGQDPTIVISFLQGEGTITPCACAGDVASPIPVARINGIAAAADGSFSILGSDCVRVQPIANGIQLIDLCSQPCCGCPELERITQDLERLDQERLLSQDFVARLQTSVDTMDQIVLGARLSDRSCFTNA